MKPLISLTALAVAIGCSGAQAQYTDGTIRIGVLNDMSGTYADLSGRGSLIAARMAVEDFGAAAKGMKVEIVGADHQNKPDVGSNIARMWIDTGRVDVIVDVPTSSVALAVNEIVRDKNKVFLVSGGATSDLTGAKCTPNTIHWTYDTWALANGTGQAIVKTQPSRLHDVHDLGRDDGAAHDLLDCEFSVGGTFLAIAGNALNQRCADRLKETNFPVSSPLRSSPWQHQPAATSVPSRWHPP
jgi:ABC-type branched-subunit amino acid transport system substrate-binding protein